MREVSLGTKIAKDGVESSEALSHPLEQYHLNGSQTRDHGQLKRKFYQFEPSECQTVSKILKLIYMNKPWFSYFSSKTPNKS